jgi:3',5'-cyclic AMP phosphodiesterase CpdA
MRLLHISDLHFWHIPLNPLRLAGKRVFGVCNLILNRARKFRMETMPAVVRRVHEVEPDHVLITGDLTTTALEEEFQVADQALRALALEPDSLTMIPGNHDRYTRRATSDRLFEKYFGRYAADHGYPWLKWVGADTAILALDACRPTRMLARGSISAGQLETAQTLLDEAAPRIGRLLIACHYPAALPSGIRDSHGHGLAGREHLLNFLARQAPHLYFHGHIHTAWSFVPDNMPRTICLNPGAAFKRNIGRGEHASMLEVILNDASVEVRRHVLRGVDWKVEELVQYKGFFNHGS